VAKNNSSLVEIIKSIVFNCGFESLKTFVFEVLANTETDPMDKVREVSLMLVSLDSILTSSIHNMPAKPKPPFLPPNEKPDLYTLVLDMDETLIHTKEMQSSKSIFLIRPYCQEFLDEMSKHFEIVIFTAAVKEYADKILDSIDEPRRIAHRLYREHTRIEDYVSIKDLGMIGRDLSRCIIIDNIASNFKLQPRNGIAISTWTG
jgi:Dullard-like phosphatase family protein